MNRWLLGMLGFLGLAFSGGLLGAGPEPVRLLVKEVPLEILGKQVAVIAIEQADGTHGYSPEQSDGFHVEVVSQSKSRPRFIGMVWSCQT
jgi:hypothetical protein